MLARWLEALQALLPPGRAFTREPGSVLTRLLSAIAAVLAAVQINIEALAAQSDPRLAVSMLSDWETMLGLPDACSARALVLLQPGLYPQDQIELQSFQRGSSATYVDAAGLIKTAGANVPRFVAGQLLMEASATNLVEYSNSPGNAWWGQTGLIITPGAAIGPDGTLSASKVAASTANSAHRYLRGVVVPAGAVVTRSIYVKPAEHARFRLYVEAPGGNSFGASFNLSTVAHVAFGQAGTGVTLARGMQALGNGWYRCWVTGQIVGQTDYYYDLRLIEQVTSQESWAGDGVSGLLVYGDQFEVGAAPTSYIATSGAPGMRAADVAYQLSPQSSVERASLAYQRLTELGGQSRAYFTNMAQLLGEPGVTISEFAPMHCNDDCNDALYSQADAFVWRVNIPRAAQAVVEASCNSTCNDYLQVYAPALLECAFQKRKPVHSQVIFAYNA